MAALVAVAVLMLLFCLVFLPVLWLRDEKRSSERHVESIQRLERYWSSREG